MSLSAAICNVKLLHASMFVESFFTYLLVPEVVRSRFSILNK